MHLFLTHLLLQSTTATTTKSKSSGSSSYTSLLIIVVIFVAAYFLFLRPRQQRMKQQQGRARQISIGDEVMSAGGIFGRVVAMDDDQVEVEVSPGVVMTFLPKAVSPRPQPTNNPPRRAAPPADEPWDVPSTPHDGSPDAGDGPSAGGAGGERDDH